MQFAAILPTSIERLVKAVGWSPIGKLVDLLIVEGRDPGMVVKRLIGSVSSLNADGSAAVNPSTGDSFKVAPRHVGYGCYYLRIGRMAAYRIADSRTSDGRMAQGMLSLH